METFISDLSKLEFPASDRVQARSIRSSILHLIRKDYPGFTESGCLSINEVNIYRQKYIANLLISEIGELSELDKTVVDSLQTRTTITPQVEDDQQQPLTTGQRVADKVATFGGSWRFIISFGIFLLVWIAANAFWLSNRSWDPYPFILLNLILSCLAALQAPVIMMSQNRQEEKDRDRAKKDYMINLKSELEIRLLHEKIDHLIMHQQQELLEIQKVQVEMMTDIINRIETHKQ